jgi:ketosteroid isomerase-like protein
MAGCWSRAGAVRMSQTLGGSVAEDNNPTRDAGFLADLQVPRGTGSKSRSSRASKMEELYRKLEPELRRTKPNPEAIAAALEAAQRLVTEAEGPEADAEDAAEMVAQNFIADPHIELCPNCGYRNRAGNKFCGMCGVAARPSQEPERQTVPAPPHDPAAEFQLRGNGFANEPHPPASQSRPAPGVAAVETHHYHHHYHHHYFPAGYESGGPRLADSGRAEPSREDKFRPSAAMRGDLNRAEAGVRRVTQEWVLACNTKHLDDLLDLYAADALVLRSNYPPVRGAAAVREFFFAALDAGLGEVELEPLRVEIAGDLAYEAGKCKALVPGATGKRREERGKYLWVCARQSNGEWKLTADCWSSDLSLGMLESDVPASAGVKTSNSKKS